MLISDSIQQELRKQYNPDGSSLRKAQMRMVEMLCFFDSFCKKHNLNYWLDAGTLLGAVRHGGFIPWDDDTDVMMPKRDYERLKRLMVKELSSSDFVLQCHETDPGYWGPWIVLRDKKSEYLQDSNLHRIRKYRGLQIDIFPCDYRFIRPLLRFCRVFQYHLIDWPLKQNNSNRTPLRVKIAYYTFHKFIIPVFRIISFPFKHKYFRCYYGLPWPSRRNVRDVYPLGRILFEGVELNSPSNPENCLKSIYGDWKMIPTKDNIKTHNVEVVFH